MDAKEGPMSFYSGCRSLPQRFRLVLSSFMQRDDLPFAEVLPEAMIEQAFADADADFAREDDDVYTPALTLWAFLSQALGKAELRSCRMAVARVSVLLMSLGKPACSDNTGAYCRARAKLPAAIIGRLSTDVADGCEQRLPERWLWKGRHVHLVDGTTASMPDTTDNQAAYPQANTQKEGVGFPIARVVVLLSLATAMVKGMAMGPYAGKETGETALLRELFAQLGPGDILLADRYYCSYFMIALLQELHIDVVARLHQRRDVDFRRGQRLGAGDHVVTWTKPARPDWMDETTYQRMPASIQMREVQVQVRQPGFRVESLVVVTTLTDAQKYPKEDIGELYHQRWLVELDIRTIKVTMGMDVLRCQSAEMVRREIWTCLLAYNLIRQTMLEAALQSERSPRELSFTAALQKIAAAWAVLSVCDDTLRVQLIDVLLSEIANNIIGNRPDRVEPRAVKRRPKPHKLLTEPRAAARAKLLHGTAA
jgi:putative transposase